MRLRKLEKAGIISGYHATDCHARRRAGRHRADGGDARPAIARRISTASSASSATIPEIVACWSVGGGVDYVLKVMARDIDAYQRLVDALLEREIGIDRYFTYIVTKTVKEETVLPVADLLPLQP